MILSKVPLYFQITSVHTAQLRSHKTFALLSVSPGFLDLVLGFHDLVPGFLDLILEFLDLVLDFSWAFLSWACGLSQLSGSLCSQSCLALWNVCTGSTRRIHQSHLQSHMEAS